MESVRKLIRKLGSPGQLRACYEAGPTCYALYWQLVQLGVKCEVIAPTLMPMSPVTESRPIGGMRSAWPEAIGPGT